MTQPSTLGATALQLIATIVGLAVGLGAFGEPTAQIIVSLAGIVIGAIIQIVNQLHLKTVMQAAQASDDTATLRAIASGKR